MSELVIQEKIVINELENVLEAIYGLSSRKVDAEVMKRFISGEKATKFYLDSKLNSTMEPTRDSIYLWLDTGYKDLKNNPVMICLHRSGNAYVGHYTGTIRTLVNRVKNFHPQNASLVEKNFQRFVEKYQKKAFDRAQTFIADEKQYILQAVNENAGVPCLAEKLSALNLVFDDTEEIEESESELVDSSEMEVDEILEEEQEITIGILVDRIEGMERYIQELLEIITRNETRSEEQIQSLQSKNREYSSAILQMRNFVDAENRAAESKAESNSPEQHYFDGHNLLNRNEKILVLGATDIDVNAMKAIASQYFGFDKKDLEFVVDYKKIVGASHRIHNSSRYAAVILGKCPHKVADIGNWSSVIEEFKQDGKQSFYAVDARTKAGGLKVTKESFRTALVDVCDSLRMSNVS